MKRFEWHSNPLKGRPVDGLRHLGVEVEGNLPRMSQTRLGKLWHAHSITETLKEYAHNVYFATHPAANHYLEHHLVAEMTENGTPKTGNGRKGPSEAQTRELAGVLARRIIEKSKFDARPAQITGTYGDLMFEFPEDIAAEDHVKDTRRALIRGKGKATPLTIMIDKVNHPGEFQKALDFLQLHEGHFSQHLTEYDAMVRALTAGIEASKE